MGMPLESSGLGDVFADAALNAAALTQDLRLGVESMPPHDRQPVSSREIDLRASHGVRLRFRPARCVRTPAVMPPQTWVLSSVAYFLRDDDRPTVICEGDLPQGLQESDTVDTAAFRMGQPSIAQDLDPARPFGYQAWDAGGVILHLLFEMISRRLVRVTVYLPGRC